MSVLFVYKELKNSKTIQGDLNMEQYETLLSVKIVAKEIGIGVSTVWDWSKKRIMPTPIQITTGCTRWRKSEIQAFMRGEWKEENNNEE